MDYNDLIKVLRTDLDNDFKLELIEMMLRKIEQDREMVPAARFVLTERLRRYRGAIHHRMKP